MVGVPKKNPDFYLKRSSCPRRSCLPRELSNLSEIITAKGGDVVILPLR